MRISDWSSDVCSSDLVVLKSAMRSDLRCEFVQHVGVRLGVDFALEDLRGAGHCQIADLLAQIFAGVGDFAFDIIVRLGNDAVRSDERSVGTECCWTCRSWVLTGHTNNKYIT